MGISLKSGSSSLKRGLNCSVYSVSFIKHDPIDVSDNLSMQSIWYWIVSKPDNSSLKVSLDNTVTYSMRQSNANTVARKCHIFKY